MNKVRQFPMTTAAHIESPDMFTAFMFMDNWIQWSLVSAPVLAFTRHPLV
jgi:hypothetical protein